MAFSPYFLCQSLGRKIIYHYYFISVSSVTIKSNFFIHLLAIFIPSLGTCLFLSIACLYIQILVFSYYIIFWQNTIFSWFFTCLLTLDKVIFMYSSFCCCISFNLLSFRCQISLLIFSSTTLFFPFLISESLMHLEFIFA